MISPDAFREAMADLPKAVSVISTNGPAGLAGLTCSSVFGISAEPPMIAACVHSESSTHDILIKNGVFSVSCLAKDQQHLSNMFAGLGNVAMAERFEDGLWDVLKTGSPYYKDAMVAIDCKITETSTLGDHTLFTALIIDTLQGLSQEPLIYHRRDYAVACSI